MFGIETKIILDQYLSQRIPDALVNSTEGFEDDLTRVFDELFRVVSQKEIVCQHCLALGQVVLRLFKVKLDIQARKVT